MSFEIIREVTGTLRTNAYLIYDKNSKDAAIFDVGGKVKNLLKTIEEKELNLKFIFCTHLHFDHIQGVEKIRELLDSAANMGVRMIDWLGGDPLVRKDWYELCNYASNLGLINNIWTSGIPLANPDVAKKVVEVTKNGFVSTHLDTLDPELYTELHGGEGCDGDPLCLLLEGLFIATPIVSILSLYGLKKSSETWLALYVKRKRLEEKVKIEKLINKE